MFINATEKCLPPFADNFRIVDLDIRPGKRRQETISSRDQDRLEHLVLRSGDKAFQNMAEVFRRQLHEDDLKLYIDSRNKKTLQQENRAYERNVRSLLAPQWQGPNRELKKLVRRSLKPFRKSSGLLHKLLATSASIMATVCLMVLPGTGSPAFASPSSIATAINADDSKGGVAAVTTAGENVKKIPCPIIAFLLGGPNSTPESGVVEGCEDVKPVKVLFLGNSYTAANNLPSLVSQLACPLGYKIEYDSNTPGGYWFRDHKNNATTQAKINAQNWDFVVLQNQSQVPGWRPADVTTSSLPNAKILVNLVKANKSDTEIIYYQTWGRQNGDTQNCGYYPLVCTYEGHTAALKEGYEIYQASTGGLIAPVGSEWLNIVQDSAANRPFDSAILWSGDGSHPSQTGSYLAAAVILRQIIAAPVSASDYTAGLEATTANYILSVADTPY